ncbi:ATP-dependent DNA ligase [Streptomyces sp. NPDC002596]
MENDGHRMIMVRAEDTVALYARSGRVVTSHWMDLVTAGMELLPQTVLDGETVIWRDGRLDFAAAQSRAPSSRKAGRTRTRSGYTVVMRSWRTGPTPLQRVLPSL